MNTLKTKEKLISLKTFPGREGGEETCLSYIAIAFDARKDFYEVQVDQLNIMQVCASMYLCGLGCPFLVVSETHLF